MSADDLTASTSDADLDLDEDLFNFDEIALGSIDDDDDEADLSEVFATLDDDEQDDDLDFDPPDLIAETEAASAPVTSAEPAHAASVDPIAADPVPASAGIAPAGVAVAPLIPAAPMVVQAGGFPKSVIWIFLAITSVCIAVANVVSLRRRRIGREVGGRDGMPYADILAADHGGPVVGRSGVLSFGQAPRSLEAGVLDRNGDGAPERGGPGSAPPRRSRRPDSSRTAPPARRLHRQFELSALVLK